MTTRADASRAKLRIGTRGSALALVQAERVAARLTDADVRTEIQIIRTAGDDRAPDTVWGEGAFVTAIEAALLDRRIDVAVHSAKDVPTEMDHRLAVSAWTARVDPRDALVCRVRATTLATLPRGARVGTDSLRRAAFLRSVRPDLAIHPLSGNIDTRLRRLDSGESDALVLAVAGLERLGRADRIDEILPFDVSVPAPGQGALALQVRADDGWARAIVAALDDPDTRVAVDAERAFLAATGGGCRSPIGAIGIVTDGVLTLRVAAARGLVAGDGGGAGSVVRLTVRGPAAGADQLARDLAERVVRLCSRHTVLVTRPAEGAATLLGALEAEGLEPIDVPTIGIREVLASAELDAQLGAAAAAGSWFVATSPNGVRAALASLDRGGSNPSAVRWAVVGQASAAPLAERGIEPFIPSQPIGRALVAEMPIEPGERLVLVRSDIADPALDADARARGAITTEVVGYRTVEGPDASRPALATALDGPVDVIVFASGSAIRGLLRLAPQAAHERLRDTPAVCIGPVTFSAARSLGFVRLVEAADTSSAALVAAVETALARSPQPASTATPHTGVSR